MLRAVGLVLSYPVGVCQKGAAQDGVKTSVDVQCPEVNLS